MFCYAGHFHSSKKASVRKFCQFLFKVWDSTKGALKDVNVTWTQQRPESPVVTLTCMQVNFKKVHKLHQRYISSIAWSNFKRFFSYFFLLLLHFSLFSCSTVSHLSLEVYFSARFCNTVFIQGILCHMWLLHVYSQCGYVNQISGTPIEPDLDTFLCVNVSLCTTPTANLSARNQF